MDTGGLLLRAVCAQRVVRVLEMDWCKQVSFFVALGDQLFDRKSLPLTLGASSAWAPPDGEWLKRRSQARSKDLDNL
ncbi:hypothetical protein IFR05_000441 [Cadophora sp. M221]|nr:hypothetical protein IFR05_000441 [Cadophora sp. M221]